MEQSENTSKWIMVYQDLKTKFCILRALISKHPWDIFLTWYAPSNLQSDNGAEFIAEIITELKDIWPKLKLVHGKPRHPQNQGSVDRANQWSI